ncbi:patatin [Ferrimonas sediminicola]|uniref:Patatin n=1 Tax=Ferrimonas sediminicola TaxID=2569538 RepID=A0A4U1BIH9_9GAMM|nr:patatin-like phospholipase family protein [Ferrimonas sediminicola]TKB51296.1 patatin [Ferrimonas sediminicola]
MLRKLLVLLLLLPLWGQASERPTVGVVLSGGGAKGAAHIGVLRVLEQNRIPVDYIAGTSMGSYVAGLYALGYSADEIEATLLSMDFNTGFDDDIPRESLSYRHKQQRDDFPLGVKMGYRDGELRFPKGALQGQTMRSLIRRSVGTIPEIGHFDDLAIPLRTVATDLADRSEVVLESGNLVMAMQASMTIPGALAPIEIDGRMLVDGGMANNLPVSVVKAMGADVVIAVDIGTPLKGKDDLKSVFDIVDQLTGYLTNLTRDQQVALMGERDILLVPEIDGVGTTDFDLMSEMIPRGEAAARTKLDALRALSLPEGRYKGYLAQKQALRSFWHNKGAGELVAIELDNDSWVTENRILAALGVKPGQPLAQDEIEQAIARVYALNEFERVDAYIQERPEGRVLVVDTDGKSWGPHLFELGLRFEDDFDNPTSSSLDVAFTMNNITALHGQWRNELSLGGNRRFSTEFYLPLDTNDRWYGRGRFETQQERWERIAPSVDFPFRSIERKRDNWLAALGVNLGLAAQLELGYQYETGRVSDEHALALTKLGDYEFHGARISYGYDTLDGAMFPTQGNRLQFSVSHIDERSDITFDGLPTNEQESLVYHLAWTGATHWDQHSLFVKGELETIDSDGISFVHFTSLGGFLNLSGFYRDSLLGSHKGLVAGVYTYDLSKGVLGITWPLYLGFSAEAGNVWLTREAADWNDLIYAGSLFVGAETKLGPAAIAWGMADSGDASLYLFLGKRF